MEQTTVKNIASEFSIDIIKVIAELKKIGVWVSSPDTQVESDIANRIRKRLQLIAEAAEEEETKKAGTTKVRRAKSPVGKPRKKAPRAKYSAEKEQEAAPSLVSQVGSLKPRKGRKAADRNKPPEGDVQPEPVVETEEKEIEIIAPPEIVTEIEVSAAEEFKEETKPESTTEEPAAEEKPTEPEVTEQAEPEAEIKAEKKEPAVEKEPEPEQPKEVQPESAKKETKPPVTVAPKEVAKPKVGAEFIPVRPKEPEKKVKQEKVLEVRRGFTDRNRFSKKKKKLKVNEGRKSTRNLAPEPVRPDQVVFSDKTTVKTFSKKTTIKSSEVIRELMKKGIMATMNQVMEEDLITSLCETFEIIPEFMTFEEAASQIETAGEKEENLSSRAPVVTVMGHVDHGKTSLLDYIRSTHVAENEAGGITQHIGAYETEIKGNKIVFIDTPGHQAFTRMRARGANATDIVVLAVAADDGVMPQTDEAIDHAKAAGVPVIVAINKIDKPNANAERVKQELSERNLVPEDWGGDTIMVEVSAKEGTNMESLMEMILLAGEMLELKANPQRAGAGVVLEAKMVKGRGNVASILVQNGTIKIGDTFIAGATFGKVRAMFNDRGKTVKKAGPSSAVEVLGLQGSPQAGDIFQVVDDISKAREVVEFRQDKVREQELNKGIRISLDDLYAQMEAGIVKDLPIVLKADTQGSIEVLNDTLAKLSNDKVQISVIHKGVGAITENDVLLASASRAIVISFCVRPEPSAKIAAEHEDIEIRIYDVIYHLTEDVEKAMLGLLDPVIKEKHLGRLEIRETFKVPKFGTIGGSYVLEGLVNRKAELRLLRDNVLVYEGKVGSLRRFKEDASEVRAGYECGISIANFNDIKVGDVIEAFENEEFTPDSF
jgi:translation initiation factor IF-2